METHSTETTVNEGDSIDALDDATDSANSWGEAVDKALAGLQLSAEDVLEKPEPTADAAEEQVEPTAEQLEELTAEDAAEPAADPDAEPADALEELDTDVGDDWTPKAANRFKELKAELKSRSSELEELRQYKLESERRIEELNALQNDSQLEELQQKLQEYEEQRRFSDLESTEAYKQAITLPLQNIVEQADALAEKYSIDPNDLLDAMTLEDQKQQSEVISELLSDANDRDKAKVYRLIEDLEPLETKKAALYENAEQALAEAKLLEEKKAEQTLADKARMRANIARNVVERVRQKLPFLDGLENLNMEAAQEHAAQADPSTIDPVDMAYGALSSKLLPPIVRKLSAIEKENEMLLARLADYEEAEPSLSDGTSSGRASATGMSDDLTMEQRLERRLSGVS